MQELEQVLQQFLDSVAGDIRVRVPVVTGRTRDSIQTKVERIGDGAFGRLRGELTANEYIYTFEKGRGPTKPGAAKGSPTLQQAIKEWIEATGLRFFRKLKGGGVRPILPEQMSWMIAIKMHNEGNALYRKLAGGDTGVISDATNKARLEAFTKVFGARIGTYMDTQILKYIKA